LSTAAWIAQRGKITDTIADSKSGMNFLNFLVALVKSYAGRKIRLVCDNGRFQHTHAIQEWLDANSDRITIYWLPPYSPSLNLIERLWGHLKRTVLANVLLETLNDLPWHSARASAESMAIVTEWASCLTMTMSGEKLAE
jgi:transposase